jgi:hypothetical protein
LPLPPFHPLQATPIGFSPSKSPLHNTAKAKNPLNLYSGQSWAHRSFELSDRSKAMSDPWFSERKEKSEERRANCKKKEFADRSKRSLNWKERSAKPHFEQFALERCKVKRVDNPFGTISAMKPLHRNPHLGCLQSFANTISFFCFVYYTKVSTILRNYTIFGNSDL